MVKVFWDTSVLVRYFTRDDESKYKEVVNLYERVADGRVVPYVSTIVLMELYYVLNSVYAFGKEKCLSAVRAVMEMRNCVIVGKTDIKQAMKCLEETGVKLSDCIIATQVPKRVKFITYDKEFSRIEALNKVPLGKLIA